MPKEKDSKTIGQFRIIHNVYILIVEGKMFLSVLAKWLSEYRFMVSNKY